MYEFMAIYKEICTAYQENCKIYGKHMIKDKWI